MKNRPSYNFKPSRYKLKIKTNQKDGTFEGVLEIEGQKLPPPSKRITLNQKGLKISSATVIYKHKKGDIEFEVSRINHLKSFQEVRLHTNNLLYPGQYIVKLEYSGKAAIDNFECLNKPSESWHNLMPCIDEPDARKQSKITISSNISQNPADSTNQ